MNAPARKIEAAPPDVSNAMRENRIRCIHWDPLLDRFSVILLDYRMGLGGSAGEALADAERRAA